MMTIKLRYYGNVHTGRTQIVSFDRTTRKERLKQVIETTLRKFKVAILMHDVGFSGDVNQDSIIDSYTNVILKEVSIRTPLK